MRDMTKVLKTLITLPFASRTANATGNPVDLAGFDSATILVVTGTITDGTHEIGVQESADGTTWTAVASSDLVGTVPSIGATNDDTVYEIGYVGTKRYLRLTVTVSGATAGGAYGAIVVLGNARKLPV